LTGLLPTAPYRNGRDQELTVLAAGAAMLAAHAQVKEEKMHRSRPTAVAVATVFALAGFAASPTATAATSRSVTPAASASFITQLRHLPGVTYLGKNPNAPAGYQVYELEIRQPVNHHQPHGATFEQHLELYQRNLSAPMVMYVSGYFNYTFLGPKNVYLSTATTLVKGNQISVEHRFYGNSVPHPTRWKYLTVWQEAADEHHVVQVFKKLYHARWLISGVSKGGETAIFHDYFYPHDFAGTFAWSAPSITATPSDSYENFLAKVGTASCRAALLKTQFRALRHRAAMETMLAAEAKAAHGTFQDWVGGLDENFELTVLLTPFAFWQYGGNCATVPGSTASLKQLYQWFDLVAGWLAADDQENAPFVAYNYQAGTQLGYPILHDGAEFGSLLHYSPLAQQPEQDLPPGVPVRPLSQQLMRAVHQWVLRHGSHLLFLYGQDDPWSSQRFDLGTGSHDSASYTVAGGNHLSPYTDLPAAEQKSFVTMLRTWAGLSAPAGLAGAAQPGPAPMTGLAGRLR
jgi:PS-10 peptidase S37